VVKPKPVSHALPAATIPGAVLMLAVLGANQLDDGPRDLLDPRLRGARL